MKRPLLIAALCVVALAAVAAGDAVEQNREQLAKYRDDPAHMARLQGDLAAFRGLSAERQDRLRKLERDLQDESPAMHARLNRVMDRYADWLDKLPEAERHSIEKAPDRKAKLARIREIREQQWVKRLPKAKQDQIAKASADERPKLVRQLWDEEWEQRAEWQVVARHAEAMARREPLPVRLNQLPEETQKYINEKLLPLLSRDEERRLHNAEGKWPRYMRTLVELLDAHPVSVLGPIGPTHADDADLPAALRDYLGKLEKTKKFTRLTEARGKWPEYGMVLQDMRRNLLAKFPPPVDDKFMPSRPGDFPSLVQVFLEKRLQPALDEEDRIQLQNAVRRWPGYQRKIVELARKHNLQVPLEKPLPGPSELYDRYRVRSVTPERKTDPVALGQ